MQSLQSLVLQENCLDHVSILGKLVDTYLQPVFHHSGHVELYMCDCVCFFAGLDWLRQPRCCLYV